MKDCRECLHGQVMIHTRRMCSVFSTLRPIEFMRHALSECGPDAVLFDPKSGVGKYSEFDNEQS
jgi:hypothetical protein